MTESPLQPASSQPELIQLSAKQKQFFDTNGYIHLPGLFDADEVARMRQELHELITNVEGRHRSISHSLMDEAAGFPPDPYNPQNLSGIMNQVAASDYWFDHMTDPRIVGAMTDLLGANIDFHNGKIRNKPPGFECTQSWHQDFPYERHSLPRLAAALTYLEATDLNAGATEVVPGSHLRGEWPMNDDGVTIPEHLVEPGSWEVCKAGPGDVVIIHVLVVHRAGHNRTPISRHAIINEYKAMEAIDQWGNRLAYANLPLSRAGQRLPYPRLVADAWKV